MTLFRYVRVSIGMTIDMGTRTVMVLVRYSMASGLSEIDTSFEERVSVFFFVVVIVILYILYVYLCKVILHICISGNMQNDQWCVCSYWHYIFMLMAQYLHEHHHYHQLHNWPETESCWFSMELLFTLCHGFVTQLVCSYPEHTLVMHGIAELPELLNYCAFITQLKGKHSTLMGRHSTKLLCNVAFHLWLTQKQIRSTMGYLGFS